MKTFAITLALLATTTAATAQRAPELTGIWTGQWRTVIFGSNPHHPGSQTTDSGPRVREINFTIDIEGQSGRLIWGHSWSDPARKEPFAATITQDGLTIIGSDTDGSLTMRIVAGRNELEACYTHTALGPSKSIVASCGDLRRQQR
ncbi:MAG: hypothetical protein HXY30_10305 [Pseudorhodoplanes sp.]|nr:hypothetical protein [Pseudorhodoplanes sp.]